MANLNLVNDLKSKLKRMIKFYTIFDNAEIVATLSQQFVWSKKSIIKKKIDIKQVHEK